MVAANMTTMSPVPLDRKGDRPGIAATVAAIHHRNQDHGDTPWWRRLFHRVALELGCKGRLTVVARRPLIWGAKYPMPPIVAEYIWRIAGAPPMIEEEDLLDAYPKLRRAALALTRSPDRADDLVQDTYERIFRNIDKFRGGSVIAWALTIMRNAFIDSKRRRTEEDPLPEGDEIGSGSLGNPGEDLVMLRRVSEILEELGGRCADVILLRAIGFKYREIAGELKLPPGTVARTVMECLEMLHQRIAWQ